MAYKKWVKKEIVHTPPTFNYPPSAEQAAIFDALRFGDANIHGEAGAGSGKSTTALRSMYLEKRPLKIGIGAFNSSIARELEGKVPKHVTAKTFHAFGLKSVTDKWGRPIIPDAKRGETSKGEIILLEVLPWIDPSHVTSVLKGQAWNLLRNAMRLVSLMKLTLADENSQENIEQLIGRYNLDFSIGDGPKKVDRLPDIISALPRIMDKHREMVKVIDFDDMMWLPIQYDLNIEKFDLLYADEWQDANNLMIEYVRRMSEGGRVVTIGDRYQCQPEGTQVLISDGSYVDIKDVQVGWNVVSYDHRSVQLVRRKQVLQKAERYYEGDMYIISCGESSTRCTPNHKWTVKWSDEFKDKHVVYLMSKNNQFRIGKCQSFYESDGLALGVGMRARQEKADNAWILRVCNSDEEAAAYEDYYSSQYNIPQSVFVNSNNKNNKQDYIDELWKKIGININYANALLVSLKLDIDYPIWEKESGKAPGFSRSFTTQACNLISGMMMVPQVLEFTQERGADWRILKVETQEFKGMVYSLDVQGHHNYVSDQILTNNSIYGFAGANTESIEKSIQLFASEKFPLMTCYRCGHLIIAEVNKIMPDLRAFEKNPQGEVRRFESADEYEMENVPDGAMVLCRRNAGLIKPCFQLLKKGRKAIIKGKDIGEGLISTINQIQQGDMSMIQFLDAAEVYRGEKISAIMQRKRPSETQIEMVDDTHSAIVALAENCHSVSDLKTRISDIFSDGTTQGVTLSSMHKSKGLEADHVVIVQADKIRLNNERMTAEDHIQERNLEYVAKSRAKLILDLVPS